MGVVGGIVVVVAIFAVIVLGSAIRILREYERGVIFRLGRLIALKGPGLIVLIPFIDRMVRVDLRTVTLNVPPQEVITRDNVPTSVNAVIYFRVMDANRAIVEVENYLQATSQIAQTALRSILGKAELDQLLAERERLNEDLQKVIDEATEPWGIKVSTVEIKEVEIPGQMHRALARQAEAERERRAKIINSEGEFQAAQKLADAADIISQNPASIQLRYLQTLLEIGGQQNTTVVFPLPMDIIKPFQEMAARFGPSGDLPDSSGGSGEAGGSGGQGARPKPPRPEVPPVPPVPSELAGTSRVPDDAPSSGAGPGGGATTGSSAGAAEPPEAEDEPRRDPKEQISEVADEISKLIGGARSRRTDDEEDEDDAKG